jgi:hypothetical protein
MSERAKRRRDVYYRMESESGESVEDVKSVAMNQSETVDRLAERIKRERRVLSGVESDDLEISLVEEKGKEKVCVCV